MGSSCKESFDEFLALLKKAGIEITNEAELRERLAEAQRWQYAFKTLAANGRQLGIRFGGTSNEAEIHRAFAEFQLSESTEAVFTASLKSQH